MLKFINQKYTNLDVSQFISMIKSSTDTVYKSFGNTDRDKEIYGVVEVNYFNNRYVFCECQNIAV